MGSEYVPLKELFARCDFVSLHVPANASTRHLVSREILAAAKPGLILINTARGPVVDSEALAEALESGRLAAAGLDVFDTEPPLAADYALMRCRGTVLTPHIAYRTRESMELRAAIVFRNIECYLSGKPQNVCGA